MFPVSIKIKSNQNQNYGIFRNGQLTNLMQGLFCKNCCSYPYFPDYICHLSLACQVSNAVKLGSVFRKGRQTNTSRLKRHVRGVQHAHSFMRALFFSYQILSKCKFLPSPSQQEGQGVSGADDMARFQSGLKFIAQLDQVRFKHVISKKFSRNESGDYMDEVSARAEFQADFRYCAIIFSSRKRAAKSAKSPCNLQPQNNIILKLADVQ